MGRPRSADGNMLMVLEIYFSLSTAGQQRCVVRHQISLNKNPSRPPFYSSSDLIFSRRAFRLGPILSGCMRQRCCLSASILANFSWHTEQRKGALTTSRADLRRQRPTPQKTIIFSSRMQLTTWMATDYNADHMCFVPKGHDHMCQFPTRQIP